MKKIYIVLFALVVLVGLLFASGNRFRVQDNDGNIVWRLISTGADTSRVYRSDDVMTIFYWCADTTADDSVDLDLTFQMQGAYGWYDAKTTTVTAESTQSAWLITNTAVASGNIWRLIVTGSADNSKSDTMQARFTYDSGN